MSMLGWSIFFGIWAIAIVGLIAAMAKGRRPRTEEEQRLDDEEQIEDASTLKPIEELYVEIKWDGESGWQAGAQKAHGMTKEYLEENGMTNEEAVMAIGSLISKHFADGKICLLGHNVVTFDIWFLKRLFRKFDIELKFGARHIDTNSVGFVNWETFNSDDLFELVGFDQRGKHNALDDARMALEAARQTRVIFKSVF